MKKLGAYSEDKKPNEKIQGIADAAKPQVESQLNKTFGTFQVEKFTQQVVGGMNYKIKVKVGDGEFIHIKVFQHLPNSDVELKEVEEGKSLEDDFS